MSSCQIISLQEHGHKTNKTKNLTAVSRTKRPKIAEKINKPLGQHDGLEILVANSPNLKDQCHALMYDIYLDKGYIQENINKRHRTPYDLLPEAVVFIALDRGEAVGTMTIIPDNRTGLPAEEIYDEELKSVRTGTSRVCEITSLGIKKDARFNSNILIKLFNAATLCAYGALGLSHFVITVNPRHKSFYERKLLFSQVGKQKECPKVNSAPAVLLKMDLEEFETTINDAHPKSSLLLKYFVSAKQGKNLISKYGSALSNPSDYPDYSFAIPPREHEYISSGNAMRCLAS